MNPHQVILDIERFQENQQTYLVGTSPDIQGLVAEAETIDVIELAQDLIPILMELDGTQATPDYELSPASSFQIPLVIYNNGQISFFYCEVTRKLRKQGFVLIAQEKVIMKFGSPFTQLKTTIPHHREIKEGTLRNIIKQCQVSIEEFLAL